MLRTLCLLSLATVTYAQIRCAGSADYLTTPVFISNHGALNSKYGSLGSAVFDFGDITGSFWAKTRCYDGNADSWFVNGQVWHVPHSTAFKWHEFGALPADPFPSTTVASLVPREPGCEIQAVYYGDNGDTLNTNPTPCGQSGIERGYLCPSQMSLHYPVFYNPTTSSIESLYGIPLAGSGRAELQFSWKDTFGPANLWFFTQCPDEHADSWFVNGTMWGIPHSPTFTWNKFGQVTNGGVLTLTPRETRCKIRFAYLGNDIPSEIYVQGCPSDESKCPSEAVVTGSVGGVADQDLVSGCSFATCAGSATFDFGTNRGNVWAYTQCVGGSSDSWFVNGQVWHIPQSATYQWHKYGPVDGTGVVVFDVREANCHIGAVFRGVGEPFLQTCPEPTVRLNDQCKPGVNCFHGSCADNTTWCECNFYAFGCQCDQLWSGIAATPELCAFNYAIDISTGPAFEVLKPEDVGYNPSSLIVYYTHPRTLYKMTINAATSLILSRETCYEGDFVNANGITIDLDSGVYVADSQASKLFYVSPSCDAITTVIPSGHTIASPGDVEILHAHGLLIVASWGRPGIYFVEVDSSHNLVRYQNTDSTVLLAHGLTECVDTSSNNGFLFIEQGNRVVFFDVNTKNRTVILDQPSGVVDITDLAYRQCGIFFTANDNNQVWHCAEVDQFLEGYVAKCNMNGVHCRKMCDRQYDSASCDLLMNPSGLLVDCACNVFVGNKGNGNLVMYPQANGTKPTYLGGDVFANDIEYYGPSQCGIDTIGPIVTLCGSSSSTFNSQHAGPGEIVTIAISANERILKPTISCAVGGTPLGFVVSGADAQRDFDATYTIQLGDPVGLIVCSLGTPIDLSGNAGSSTYNNAAACQVTIVASSSPTPTRTTTPSTSSSPSPSVSPSPSPSPSITPTRSVTPSVTPSPSVTPVLIQMDMVSTSGTCTTQDCIQDGTDNVTIRVGASARRFEAENNAARCASDGGSITQVGSVARCMTVIPWGSMSNWDIADFDVYRQTPDLAPPFLKPVGLYNAGVHPNTLYPYQAVAAAIDCTGLPTPTILRWVFERKVGGPCYADAEYGKTFCSNPGVSNGNTNFFSRTGEVMGTNDIYYVVLCPFNF